MRLSFNVTKLYSSVNVRPVRLNLKSLQNPPQKPCFHKSLGKLLQTSPGMHYWKKNKKNIWCCRMAIMAIEAFSQRQNNSFHFGLTQVRRNLQYCLPF